MSRRWVDANCLGVPVDVFTPDADDPRGIAKAKRYCERCVVREACLASAIDERDGYTVRGGMTPAERAVLVAGDRSYRQLTAWQKGHRGQST